MGYYTKHSLNYVLKNGKKVGVELENKIWKYIKNHHYMKYALNKDYVSESKWYDEEQHMRKMSIEFPEILFIISGEGEEAGDIWKAYYLNGKRKYEEGELKVDGFNPNKTKGGELIGN